MTHDQAVAMAWETFFSLEMNHMSTEHERNTAAIMLIRVASLYRRFNRERGERSPACTMTGNSGAKARRERARIPELLADLDKLELWVVANA